MILLQIIIISGTMYTKFVLSIHTRYDFPMFKVDTID